jgi:hypothetical protein
VVPPQYEKVKENERVEALRERAQIIVDMELQHPSWHKVSLGLLHMASHIEAVHCRPD